MNNKNRILSLYLIGSYLILTFTGIQSLELVIKGNLPKTGLENTFLYLLWFLGSFSAWFLLTNETQKIHKFLIILISLLAFLCPPLSQDVFNYVASARVQIAYEQNPYLYSLHYLNPNDLFLGTSVWDIHVTPYGPIITALQSPLGYLSIFAEQYFSSLEKFATLIPVYGFKLLLLIFHFININLVSLITRKLDYSEKQRNTTIWLYGANPIILYESIATGHNDLLIVSFLLASLYLFLVNKKLFSICLALVAFLGKYTSGIYLAAFFSYFLHKKQYKNFLIFALLSLLTFANLYLWIESLPPYKLFLSKVAEVSWGSVPHYLAEFIFKDTFKETSIFKTFYILGCLAALASSFFFIKKDKILEAFTIPLFIFCLFTTPVHNNWYMILPTTFAALLRPGTLRNSIFLLAACSQLALIQFIIYIFDIWPHPETQIALTFIPTYAYLTFKLYKNGLKRNDEPIAI